MSTKCLSWGIEQIAGSSTRKIVLLLLCDLADEQYTCYPGRSYLAERAELSESVISRAITQLAADGFVRVLRRAKTRGGRRSNRYLVLVDGEHTPLPDVDDWVSEFAPDEPDDDETAGQGNDAAAAHMPVDDAGQPDETPGQSNGAAGTLLPAFSNSAAGAHTTVPQEHSSIEEDLDPLLKTQDQKPTPPTFTHSAPPASSAAAAETMLDELRVGEARTVLRRVTVDVDALRLPTGVERGRLVERVVDLIGAGWEPDDLVARLVGMGSLGTVASVYAVLISRLRGVGDPPTPPAEPAEALPWCRQPGCDRTTRRLVDEQDRPKFEHVDGRRVPLWCPDCSGR